jgi:3-oxoacyl-[acyl-carrier-protein] synthase-3
MSFLSNIAAYVPSRIVGNAELEQMLGTEAERIKQTSGIEERRFAAQDETVVEMAVAAGRKSLSAGEGPAVEMLIVASGSANRRFPGPAASIARALNLGSIPAIDLPMPSAGAVFGIALASGLTPSYRQILVIAAEKMSQVVSEQGTHPNVAVLFGDGAGACIVSRDRGVARIVDVLISSDGTFAEALQLGFTGPMTMDGRTVIMQASRKIPETMLLLLARNQVPLDSVSAFVLHQANQNLINQVAHALGMPLERFVSNIERYGNTSSASVLIALAEWECAVGFKPHTDVVMAAFGAGLHWGSILLRGTEPSD